MRSLLPLALVTGMGLGALAIVPSPAAGRPGAEEIRRLIDQLGSANFSEREEATQALDAAGEPALTELRRAAESEDAEVRRRAGDLVRKIEQRVETAHLVAPTKVKLSFKDAPLAEVADKLSKQIGYSIVLKDPKGKLKNRKVTLDTGEVSFWEALDLVCSKANVCEEETLPPDTVMAVNGPGVALPPGVPGVRPGMRTYQVAQTNAVGQLTLIDAKQPLPAAAYAGAVRVRGHQGAGPGRDAGQIALNLVVTAEPKVRCQDVFTLRIDKVEDDQGQELSPVDEGVPPPVLPFNRNYASPYTAGVSVQHLQVRLNAGEKPARSLRSVEGVLSGRLFTEPRPVIVVDDVLKSAGKVFPGVEGGAIKVLEVTREDAGHLTIRYDFESPPEGGVLVGAVRLRGARGAGAGGAMLVPMPAAPGPQVGGRNVGGFSLLDDKGKVLPASGGRLPAGRGLVREYTMEYAIPAGRQPARFTYSASKAAPVNLPFVLKNVPLP